MSARETLGGEFGAVLASARAGESWALERIYTALSPAVAGLLSKGPPSPSTSRARYSSACCATSTASRATRRASGRGCSPSHTAVWPTTAAAVAGRPSPTWGDPAGQAASAATRPATPAGSSMGRRHAHARVGLPVYACGAWSCWGRRHPASVGVWLPSRPRSRPPDWQRVPRSRFARASVACE